MKRCCTCHLLKPVGEFHRYKRSPDGRQPRCKGCFAEQYRQEGVELRAKIERRQKRLRAEKIRLMTQYLSSHPCVDCGEDDIRVLDFDHRDPSKKRGGIAKLFLGGWTWQTLLEEMEKCDVRCANCHRVRTSEDQGWWKQAAEAQRRTQLAASAHQRLVRLMRA